MRQSKEVMAESRTRILSNAARLFRERGINAVSVVDVMQASGMTHGGFYKHFASKDQLVSEAVKSAFDMITSEIDREAETMGLPVAVSRYVNRYVSEWHLNNAGYGCPVAALGGEIARSGHAVKTAYDAGVEAVRDRVASGAFGNHADARDRAVMLLMSMTGTVVTARATENPELRKTILAAGAQSARQQLEHGPH